MMVLVKHQICVTAFIIHRPSSGTRFMGSEMGLNDKSIRRHHFSDYLCFEELRTQINDLEGKNCKGEEKSKVDDFKC